MKLWVVVVFFIDGALSLATVDKFSCNYPPYIWCSSKEIASLCKVTDQCAETSWNLKDSADKVNFTLYYESLCPDCEAFINLNLYPSYLKVGKIMQLSLVPYGNAREKREEGKWKYDCQHGPQECIGNLIDTCAIYYMKTVEKYFPFIHCMEKSQFNPTDAAKECAGQFSVPLTEILDCANSSLGNTLEHEMAKKTDKLIPRHEFVPWVTLNGVHSGKIQQEAEDDLVKLICRTYQLSESVKGTEIKVGHVVEQQGRNKPEACDEFKMDSKKRCYNYY